MCQWLEAIKDSDWMSASENVKVFKKNGYNFILIIVISEETGGFGHHHTETIHA